MPDTTTETLTRFCKDCRWFVPEIPIFGTAVRVNFGKCCQPDMVKTNHDYYVTGEGSPTVLHYCSTNRVGTGCEIQCGVEGSKWEAKP